MKTKEITDKELKAWGIKKFPDFSNNLELMKVIWEKEQGIKTDMVGIGYNSAKVKDIKTGDFVELSVLVADMIVERKYIGCGVCRRKAKDVNKSCICGNAEYISYTWKNYVAGDNTGNVVLNVLFPRKDGGVINEGRMQVLKGKVGSKNKQGMFDFMVNKIETGKGDIDIMKVEDKELKKAVDEILDFFELYENEGVEEETLKKWFNRQDFKIGYDTVMSRVKVRKDKDLLFVDKEDGGEARG